MQIQTNPKLMKKPEEFIKHWGSFRLYDESPMQTYFRQIDLQFREETQGKYIENALQMPPEYMNQLLLADWRFRADAKMNIIASTEGEQGCQPKGSKVLMANKEWKNIEDVVVGDEVISPQEDGRPEITAKVTRITHWFCKKMYGVYNQNNKLLYSCSNNHLIPVWCGKKIFLCLPTYLKNKKTIPKDWFIGVWNNKFPIKKIKFFCKELPPQTVYGFMLDSESKWYVTDNFLITHNSGKSLSSSYACLLLAKIFGSVFSPANVVYDPEELDKKLETAAYRSTWLLDEQKKTNVGIMSQTTNLRLADFEDQLRYSQINLWYASPTLRDHTHFFIFETFKIERVKPEESPICAVCTKIRENPTVCHDCKVPEQERIGYPKSFLLMLKTKRLLEPYPVPRGLVRFKMPNPHFSKEYDELKKAHIKKLQNKESQFWEILKEKANKIWELDSEKLIVTQKNGNLAPANSKKIRISIYDKFGMRAFTKEAEDLLCELIAQKAQEHIMRMGENDVEEETEGK